MIEVKLSGFKKADREYIDKILDEAELDENNTYTITTNEIRDNAVLKTFHIAVKLKEKTMNPFVDKEIAVKEN